MLKNLRSFFSKAKKNKHYSYALLACILLCVLIGCGKKPKNILAFDEPNKKQKIRRIFYPTVKNISIKPTQPGTQLSWKPLEHENLKGYNVYRFSQKMFIPKNPINKKPLLITEFIDSHSPRSHKAYYVVSGVFESQGNLVVGPLSQIIVGS